MKIEHICGIPKLEEINDPLNHLIEKKAGVFGEWIESVANGASKGASFLKRLPKIKTAWEQIEFRMVLHRSTIRSSRFVSALKSQVDDMRATRVVTSYHSGK
jgi:hypothetical protein